MTIPWDKPANRLTCFDGEPQPRAVPKQVSLLAGYHGREGKKKWIRLTDFTDICHSVAKLNTTRAKFAMQKHKNRNLVKNKLQYKLHCYIAGVFPATARPFIG